MSKKFLFCFCFLFGTVAAHAPDLLQFATGVCGSHKRTFFSVEYRGWLKEACMRSVRPQVGFFCSEFSCYYFYFGVGYDIIIKNRVAITPTFSPGIYFNTRSGRDLGYPIEFRSSIDLSYIFHNCARFGFQIFHISNGSMSYKNPGVNVVGLFLSFPLCF